ncbi:MAG TPA: hypothetical protein VE242_03070 [Chthoniobacterales bacterium]|nr:hypothetical protein [Chthoniobacterales bacterium]
MTQFRNTKRWILVMCGFVFLCGCQKSQTVTDEELTQRLVGTWVTDEAGGNYRFYGENSFHRDGMHSADEVMHADGGTTKWSFSGMWDVRGGKLLASGEVFRSDSGAVETYRVEEKIESLTSDELVLVGADGNRLVRHRKR